MNYTECGQKTDEELVLLTLENQDYYLCLIERYGKKLFRYISRITHVSKEDIEDILQNVFIKAYENLRDFDQSLSFSSWVYRIAHNETISHHRKSTIRSVVLFNHIDNPEIVHSIPAENNIEYEIEKKYTEKNILRILEELEEKYREVLILRFLEEKDYAEISDILRKPPGTVATLLNRAKKQFKKVAQEKGIEFEK